MAKEPVFPDSSTVHLFHDEFDFHGYSVPVGWPWATQRKLTVAETQKVLDAAQFFVHLLEVNADVTNLKDSNIHPLNIAVYADVVSEMLNSIASELPDYVQEEEFSVLYDAFVADHPYNPDETVAEWNLAFDAFKAARNG